MLSGSNDVRAGIPGVNSLYRKNATAVVNRNYLYCYTNGTSINNQSQKKAARKWQATIAHSQGDQVNEQKTKKAWSLTISRENHAYATKLLARLTVNASILKRAL